MKKILFLMLVIASITLAQTDSLMSDYFKQKETALYNRAKAIEQKIIRAKADLYDAEKEHAMLIADYNLLVTEKKKYLEQKKVK